GARRSSTWPLGAARRSRESYIQLPGTWRRPGSPTLPRTRQEPQRGYRSLDWAAHSGDRTTGPNETGSRTDQRHAQCLDTTRASDGERLLGRDWFLLPEPALEHKGEAGHEAGTAQ